VDPVARAVFADEDRGGEAEALVAFGDARLAQVARLLGDFAGFGAVLLEGLRRSGGVERGLEGGEVEARRARLRQERRRPVEPTAEAEDAFARPAQVTVAGLPTLLGGGLDRDAGGEGAGNGRLGP